MYCKHCGSSIDDTAPFCSNCGKPVKDDIIEPNNALPYQQSMNGYMQQPNMYQQSYQSNVYQQPYQQVPPPYIQPTIVNFQQPVVHTSNSVCMASFICGLVGFFILPYIFGIAAIICGIVGIVTFDDQKNINKWQGTTGLILGVIDILWAIFAYAYIAALIASLFS